MTREEFIKQRCEIDKITEEEFEKRYRVVKCNCGQPYCKGYRCLDLDGLLKENQELKKQLEYLRSGEYYNQLRFENEMLQNVVDNGEVSKEDKEFIDMTHRNTELLGQQKEFISYLENEKDRLARECSHIYENSLGKTRLVNEDIFNEVDTILSKYKSIIGE